MSGISLVIQLEVESRHFILSSRLVLHYLLNRVGAQPFRLNPRIALGVGVVQMAVHRVRIGGSSIIPSLHHPGILQNHRDSLK